MINLRPYQLETIDLLNKKYLEGKRIVLTVLTGGAGKTVIACEMIKRKINKRQPSIFLAHRKELIEQCAERLEKFGISPGIIMSGKKTNPMKLIQVASIQTLAKREMPPASLVIIDEAHRSLSPQYLKVVEYYKDKGAYIIGLTGTPYRTSKKEYLGMIYEDYVANIKTSFLLDQGFVLPAKVYTSSSVVTKGMKKKMGEFSDTDLLRAFDQKNVYINLINNFNKFVVDKRTIVFCCNVDHAKKTAEALTQAGYPSGAVDGEMTSENRSQVIRDFRSGAIQVLCNYGILAEGFDLPLVEVVVLNMATLSKIKYLQACWRGSRPSPETGKDHYLVIDMADNCLRFGYPDEDLEVDIFTQNSTDSTGLAPVKVCKKCGYINHASVKCCKECQDVFPVKEKKILEDEFTELDRTYVKWRSYTQKDWHKVPTERLEEFGKVKGYSPFWAKKESQRRLSGRKLVKILNFDQSKDEYYKHVNALEKLYYNKQPIPADLYNFVEETKTHIVFNFRKKEVVNAG